MNKVDKFKIPQWRQDSFNCPYCDAYTRQYWHNFRMPFQNVWHFESLDSAVCELCEKESVWYDGVMVVPDFHGIESPNQDLDNEIIEDYKEAASILQKSPRGAAALLRLAIQKLCRQLGEPGKNIDTDIASLVTKGLPVAIQQALDSVRVIGNESVHPGHMDLKDDVKTASALFKLVNFIGEKMISEPKEVEKLYNSLPKEKLDGITKRDAK